MAKSFVDSVTPPHMTEIRPNLGLMRKSLTNTGENSLPEAFGREGEEDRPRPEGKLTGEE